MQKVYMYYVAKEKYRFYSDSLVQETNDLTIVMESHFNCSYIRSIRHS